VRIHNGQLRHTSWDIWRPENSARGSSTCRRQSHLTHPSPPEEPVATIGTLPMQLNTKLPVIFNETLGFVTFNVPRPVTRKEQGRDGFPPSSLCWIVGI